MGVRTEEIKEYHDKINNLKQSWEKKLILEKRLQKPFQKVWMKMAKLYPKKLLKVWRYFKEIFVIMDEFKENEKMLAKTIVMLPDQLLTYHETASAQINKQLDDVKRLLRNN